MYYLRKIEIHVEERDDILYVTDHAEVAERLKREGKAVLIYLHPQNSDQDFSQFLFAVEDPENLEKEYVERVYRRLKGLPWNILDTARCCVRETVPEDVDAFYRIYSNPDITKYMEGLYQDVEQEKRYVRRYMETVYTFYGYGVWTVLERESGAVIGRAGFSGREGFEDPELGFIIGVPWQGRGYAEEVCAAILRYGWLALEFEKVQALVEPGNSASLNLCRKLGFRYVQNVELQGKSYFRLLVQRKIS